MEIYGQTETIVVREMTENDCEEFLILMTERGTNEDFTVKDIQALWEFRKKKGDIQCAVTSIDGATFYGFGGILHSKLYIDIFSEYSGKDIAEQARSIIEHLK